MQSDNQNINPNGVSDIEPTEVEYRDAESSTAARPSSNRSVVVEDSVTHQAGDGMTAGQAPATETPDIFDNRPQAAVKTQTADNQTSEEALQVMPPQGEAISETRSYPLESTSEDHVDHLDRLSDGTFDVPREHDE